MINKFILKHWCCLPADEKLSGIFKFLLLISFKRDILQHLDSSTYNQAAHFLSHPTPGNLLCSDCTQCNDMSGGNYFYHPHNGKRYESHHMLTFCTVFIFTWNAWLGWSVQGEIFYPRNAHLQMNVRGCMWKKGDKSAGLFIYLFMLLESLVTEGHLFPGQTKLLGSLQWTERRIEIKDKAKGVIIITVAFFFFFFLWD